MPEPVVSLGDLRGPPVQRFAPKNDERPATLASRGRPGSPPPELLTEQNNPALIF